jgi:CubicO group peptidase (beta-lactamase class C family)
MEIRDVMAQHSGMFPYAGDLTQFAGFGPDYLLKKLKYIEPLHTFRTDFTYVNSLFLVAAKIIENITGKAFEDVLKERIFDPLGMERSTITYEEHLNNPNKTITHVYRISYEHGKKSLNISPLDYNSEAFNWSYNYAPAGGIDSTINDMLKWLEFHVNSGVFNEKTIMNSTYLDFIYTPSTIAFSNKYGKNAFYCQGWIYETVGEHVMIWHNGSTLGSKTMIAFYPQIGLGIVILSNVGGTNMPDNLVKDFFDIYTGNEFKALAMNEIESISSEDESSSELPDFEKYPPMAHNAYTGKYFNNVYGEIEVFSKDEELYMKMGPRDSVLDLIHIDRDTFSLYWDLLEMGDLGPLTFIIDSKGVAKSIEIDFIKDEGSGVFNRID